MPPAFLFRVEGLSPTGVGLKEIDRKSIRATLPEPNQIPVSQGPKKKKLYFWA
jgi:hypothetical protein